ncbi:MAG: hypothetical protein AN484_24640 [Aphanizomenon flos-aquae WA102]|uniref:Uncharacterized protein n=1 Tax=Aphanizomenon flos-aquae WA102 TaxID=1710896 RepID=A0A1B7WLG6_APHFL|nr:MAG: hypothetical protein AN484_24640 [Aphanizomenon flos-aquae WA102]
MSLLLGSGGDLAGDVVEGLLRLRSDRAARGAAEGVEVVDRGTIEHVGTEEDDQLLLLLEVGRGTEEVAQERDGAEARGGLRGDGALEAAEDDDLTAHRAHEGVRRAPADDGLVVAVEAHAAEDVFDRLGHLELHGAVLADERQDLELDADVALRDLRGHLARLRGDGRAGDDGAGFADEDRGLLVVGGRDRGHRKHLQVALARRGGEADGRAQVVGRRVEQALRGEDLGVVRGQRGVGRGGGAVDAEAGAGAADADELAVADGQAERIEPVGLVVGELHFDDHDFDADLREDDVDLVDQLVEEAKVVVGAGDHDGVATDVGQHREAAAELVGAHLRGAGSGGGRRGRGRCAVERGGPDRVAGTGGGGRLARDERGDERSDLLRVGVAEEDHVRLRVRVGLLVEGLDQAVEERVLVGRAHEQDAVGALVGEEGRARAEAEGRAAGDRGGRTQHRVELVDHVGRHRVLEHVALRDHQVELRLVDLHGERLDLLEVGDRVGDQQGVVTTEVDGRRGQRGVEARGDLSDELLGVGVLEREDLGGDAAAGRQRKDGARDELRRLGLGDEIGDDLEELISLLDHGDAVEVEQGLEGEERFVAGDRSRQ